MKLHRLRLAAIGPFAAPVEVDFSRLGASGLFLLEGPTGSGKSTVIDAVVFALYGKVAQASADDARLRSHHADPRSESVVELVFETQAGMFRVRRTPQYDRAKKNGKGTTKQQASVKLWRLSDPDDLDGGELMSNRIGEADRELAAVVGLSREQFVQTVVLPQGEFATFLRADTKTKKALLQTVFGTETVARTQLLLVSAKQDAERERATAAHAIESTIHALAGAVGLSELELEVLLEAAREPTPVTLTGQLAELHGALVSAADDAARHSVEERVRLDETRRRLADQTDLDRRRRRREELRARRVAMVEDEPALRGEIARLAAAERAASVTPAAANASRARDQLDEAVKLDGQTRETLGEFGTAGDAAAWAGQLDATRAFMVSVERAVPIEKGLVHKRSELADILASLETDSSKAETIRSRMAAIPERHEAVTSQLESAQRMADAAPAAAVALEKAQAALTAAREADRLRAEAETLATHERVALAALESAERELTSLRRSRTAMIAAELGSSLVDGDPCPVCGSAEHPSPARRGADHVEESDLETAEGVVAERADVRRRTGQRVAEAMAALAHSRQASDGLDVPAAEAAVTRTQAAVAEATEAVSRRDDLRRRRAALDDEQADLSAALHELEVGMAAARVTAAETSRAIAAQEAEVAEARGSFETVAAHLEHLTRFTAVLGSAIQASSTVERCVRAAETAAAELQTTLTEAGFDDFEQWTSALLGAGELAELRSAVTSAQARRRDVERDLADEALADPELDADPVDLELLAAEVRSLAANYDEAAGAAATRQKTAADAEGQIERITQALESHADTLRRTATAIRVGTLAAGGGENQLNMELTTYVLIRRFAEVVEAANARLRRIASGRYQLEHTDAKSGNSKSGLGLVVHDLHTGRPRDPGTLSGGETFYASLALALGLADIVRSESGGVDLQTLFIDEGFGTLDPDVLDDVLTVLASLREGGRSVGVVSHVSELKARIPDRIKVRRNPDGSSRLRTTV